MPKVLVTGASGVPPDLSLVFDFVFGGDERLIGGIASC